MKLKSIVLLHGRLKAKLLGFTGILALCVSWASDMKTLPGRSFI